MDKEKVVVCGQCQFKAPDFNYVVKHVACNHRAVKDITIFVKKGLDPSSGKKEYTKVNLGKSSAEIFDFLNKGYTVDSVSAPHKIFIHFRCLSQSVTVDTSFADDVGQNRVN